MSLVTYIVTEFPVELLEYANGADFNGVFDISANLTYPPHSWQWHNNPTDKGTG